MRKYTLTLAILLVAVGPIWANLHRTIPFKQLPRAAQELIEHHFDPNAVSHITVDRSAFDRDYTVYFAGGSSIDFDKQGAWTEVECRRNSVPDALVPAEIRRAVAERFEGRPIQKIERDRHGYEVELEGGIDLKFNHRYLLTEADD